MTFSRTYRLQAYTYRMSRISDIFDMYLMILNIVDRILNNLA